MAKLLRYSKCRYCQRRDGETYLAFGQYPVTTDMSGPSGLVGLCGSCYSKHYTGQQRPRRRKCECRRPSCTKCNP